MNKVTNFTAYVIEQIELYVESTYISCLLKSLLANNYAIRFIKDILKLESYPPKCIVA